MGLPLYATEAFKNEKDVRPAAVLLAATARSRWHALAQLLLNAAPSIRSSDGELLLYVATSAGNLPLVRMLTQEPADKPSDLKRVEDSDVDERAATLSATEAIEFLGDIFNCHDPDSQIPSVPGLSKGFSRERSTLWASPRELDLYHSGVEAHTRSLSMARVPSRREAGDVDHSTSSQVVIQVKVISLSRKMQQKISKSTLLVQLFHKLDVKRPSYTFFPDWSRAMFHSKPMQSIKRVRECSLIVKVVIGSAQCQRIIAYDWCDMSDLFSKDARIGQTVVWSVGEDVKLELTITQYEFGNLEPDLREAARAGELFAMRHFVSQGANVDGKDCFGASALHIATRSKHLAAVKLLLHSGADIDAKDNLGQTALHTAASAALTDIVEALVEGGANIFSVDDAGRTALALLFANKVSPIAIVLSATQALFKGVAKTMNGVGDDVQAAEDALEAATDMFKAAEGTLNTTRGEGALTAMKICVEYWIREARELKVLSGVPEETFIQGPESVKTYLNSLHSSSFHNSAVVPSGDDTYQTADSPFSSATQDISKIAIHLHKICVVGSSTRDKRTLIRWLTNTEAAQTLGSDTVGVDFFSYSFSRELGDGETETHKFSYWGFVGDEMYHTAHSAFFTRRTLFVVLIDLETMKTKLPKDDEKQIQNTLSSFVDENVFYWLRLIFARVPDAEVVFAGMKSDNVSDDDVDHMQFQLSLLSEGWANPLHMEAQPRRTEGEHHDISATVKAALNQWFVVSCANEDSIEKMRSDLEDMLLQPQMGFYLPSMYSRLLQNVENHRAPPRSPVKERLQHAFVRKAEFAAQMARDVSLDTRSVDHVMATLHHLGEVFWFTEGTSYRVLTEQAVLNPDIVLDLIRAAICRELFKTHTPGNGSEHYAAIVENPQFHESVDALRKRGQLHHDLLVQLPLWRDLVVTRQAVDDPTRFERVFHIKVLLREFGVAYPDRTDHPTSSLIVPAYWQLQANIGDVHELDPSRHPHGLRSIAKQIAGLQNLSYSYEWQHTLNSAGLLPRTFFEQIIVRSFHPEFRQAFMNSECVIHVCGGSGLLLLGIAIHKSTAVIRAEALAVNKELAIQFARFGCMAIEAVLMKYQGLADGVERESGSDGQFDEVDFDDTDDPNDDSVWGHEKPWMQPNAFNAGFSQPAVGA